MNRRSLILVFLAVLTAFVLVVQVVEWYTHPGIRVLLYAGIRAQPLDGFMTVIRVSEHDENGVDFPAYRAGVREGDRIVGIYDHAGEGKKIRGIFDIYHVARSLEPDRPWQLELQRADGSGGTADFLLTIPPPEAPAALNLRVITLLIYLLLPVLAIATAFIIGFSRPGDNNAFLAFLLFLGFSTIFGTTLNALPPVLREICFVHWIIFNTFVTYLFMRFFLLFPSPSYIDRKLPWLKRVFFVILVPVCLWNLVYRYIGGVSLPSHEPVERFSRWIDYGEIGLVLAMFFIGMVSLVLNTVQARKRDDRRRMVIILTGAVIGLLPPFAYFSFLRGDVINYWLSGFFLAMIGLFPLSFIYSVIKHRVFGIRLILRRGLQYALVSRGFLVVEWLLLFLILFFAAGPLLAATFPNAGSGPIAAGTALATFGLLLVLKEVNRRVLPVIDRRFFREAYDAHQILTELGNAVQRLAPRPRKLLQTVTDSLMDSFHTTQVAVFVREEVAREFTSRRPGNGVHAEKGPAAAEEDFRCMWRRVSGNAAGVDCPASGTCGNLVLHASGKTARQLEIYSFEEPEPVNVYMDDPKSWASEFSGVRSSEHPDWPEKCLLDDLNARLLVRLVAKKELLGFIVLGEKLSEEPYSKEDQALLQTVGQQVAMALDYAKMIRQVEDRARMMREIEIAKDVQDKLFPRDLPAMRHLDYAGVCRPARGVGGDYYDFVDIAPGKLGIAMGDIAGKGVSAALLMANLQAMLRSRASVRGMDLARLMTDINRLLCSNTDSQKFASFFYGLVDESSGRLTYVNAGHNPPMIFKPENGRPASLERLDSTGMIVGVFPETPYRQASVSIQKGEILVIFSDGVPEARNRNREEFGEQRLQDLIRTNQHLPASEIRDAVLAEVERFVEDAPLYDDLTIVVAKVL